MLLNKWLLHFSNSAFAQAPFTPPPANPALPDPQNLEFIQNLMRDFQELRDTPSVKFAEKIFHDPELRQALLEIAKNQNWKALLIYQLAFMGFIFILRQVEYSKLEKGDFFKRIWIALWTSAVGFFGMVILVPGVHFGKPYIKLLKVIAACFGVNT